ncbi:MAG: hypothetical protein NG784_07345 [Candidatus Jettenia sp.]|nr:hypothetical protein [Candidatus Jettenia sp.]
MKPGNDLAHQRRNKSVGLNSRWFFLSLPNVCVRNPGMRKKSGSKTGKETGFPIQTFGNDKCLGNSIV